MVDLETIRAKKQAGDRLGALKDVVSVVRIEPHNLEAWMLMSELVDEPEKKRECYRRVLVVKPDHVEARQRLAELEDDRDGNSPNAGSAPKAAKPISRRVLWLAGLAGGGLLLGFIGWLIWGEKQDLANAPVIPTARSAAKAERTATQRPNPTATPAPRQTQTLGALNATPTPEIVPSEAVTYYYARDAALWCGQGATQTPLRVFEFEVRQADYSPDGLLTALTADQALWLVNCAESRLHPIVETWQIRPEAEDPALEGSRYYPRYLDWSPDGRFIYFDTLQTSDWGTYVTDDLYRIELNTNEITPILPYGAGGQPHVSPDGSRVAAVGQRAITLANADGSEARQGL